MENENKSKYVNVLIDKETYDKLKIVAKEEGRTVTGHARYMLIQEAKKGE